MPDGATDVEVISVVHRRRKWSLEQKLALVEEIERLYPVADSSRVHLQLSAAADSVPVRPAARALATPKGRSVG